jgi:shikimate dehydrogenase
VTTRREEQGREVADLVHRVSGVPTARQLWAGDVVASDGTEILVNATHLGCAPECKPVPVGWGSLDPAATAVD